MSSCLRVILFLGVAVILLCLPACGGGTSGTGDPGTRILGKVFSTSGDPRSGVAVTVAETGDGAITDAAGEFRIDTDVLSLSFSLIIDTGTFSAETRLSDLPESVESVSLALEVNEERDEIRVVEQSVRARPTPRPRPTRRPTQAPTASPDDIPPPVETSAPPSGTPTAAPIPPAVTPTVTPTPDPRPLVRIGGLVEATGVEPTGGRFTVSGVFEGRGTFTRSSRPELARINGTARVNAQATTLTVSVRIGDRTGSTTRTVQLEAVPSELVMRLQADAPSNDPDMLTLIIRSLRF